MARILWYLFGDIDCFMRGGVNGTDNALAATLGALPDDGQSVIDNTGSATTVPGLADTVSVLVQNATNRNPNVPAWTPSDWPLGWQVKLLDAAQAGPDPLVIQPNVVSFQWPPYDGAGLNVNVSGLQPNLSDPNTIRYGDLLLQTIDYLVTDPAGRQAVLNAADGGPVNDVDLVALIKKTEPQFASGPAALPASFTAQFHELRQTTKTYFDVNAQGGVHMVLGWKEVPGTNIDDEKEDLPGNVLLAKYPCGGFVANATNE